MDNSRSGPRGRTPGLSSPQAPGAPRGSPLEAPHARTRSLAIHRERRLKVATALLVLSLALGALQFYEFVAVSFAPPSEAVELQGRVLDDTAAPVADAVVEIPALSRSTRTDADGNFTLSNVTVGRTVIIVSKDGYKTSTFTIYVAPVSLDSRQARTPGALQIPPGQGTFSQDLSATRDLFVNSCLVTLVIGLLLTLMGLVALVGRRRYRHAVLGGVGAFIWAFLFIGPLLGFAAIILIYGAREEFEDSRPLFGAAAVVPLRDYGGESPPPVARPADESHDHGEEGGLAHGDAAAGPTEEFPGGGKPS